MSVLPFPLTRPRMISPAIVLAAAVTFAVAIAFVPAPRLWANALHLGWFLIGIGLAAAVFVAMHDLSGARWHEPLRPIAARVSALLPIGSALALAAVLFGNLYAPVAGHSLRAVWLARPFVLARALVYVALWLVLSRVALQRRLSALFVVVFAFTIWLASVDWIMALDSGWSSTIFGVYQFAGLISAGIALISMIAVVQNVSSAVLHDLGKLLFAFTTFWMYIWFSQYMLIWYGNMPEETSYFAQRIRGAWGVLFVTNVLLNWAVPFILLLPQWTKRNRVILFRVAALVLVGHWIDLYLSIFPARSPAPVAGIGEVLAAGLAALLLLSVGAMQSERPPVRRPFGETIG